MNDKKKGLLRKPLFLLTLRGFCAILNPKSEKIGKEGREVAVRVGKGSYQCILVYDKP